MPSGELLRLADRVGGRLRAQGVRTGRHAEGALRRFTTLTRSRTLERATDLGAVVAQRAGVARRCRCGAGRAVARRARVAARVPVVEQQGMFDLGAAESMTRRRRWRKTRRGRARGGLGPEALRCGCRRTCCSRAATGRWRGPMTLRIGFVGCGHAGGWGARRHVEPAMTLRIGFVGCGHIATVHSYAIAQLVRAGLVDAAITATSTPISNGRRSSPSTATRGGGIARGARRRRRRGVDLHVDGGPSRRGRGCGRSGLACSARSRSPRASPTGVRVAGLLEQVPHQVGLVLRHAPAVRGRRRHRALGRYGPVLYASLRDDQYSRSRHVRLDLAPRARPGGRRHAHRALHPTTSTSCDGSWVTSSMCRRRLRSIRDSWHRGHGRAPALDRRWATVTLASVWHQVLSRGSSRRLEIFCEGAYCWTEDDYSGRSTCRRPPRCGRGRAATGVGRTPRVPDVYEKSVAQYAEPALAFLSGLNAAGGRRSGHPSATEALAAHFVGRAAYRSAGADGARVTVSAL